LPFWRRQPPGALKLTPASGTETTTVPSPVLIWVVSGAFFLSEPQPATASAATRAMLMRRGTPLSVLQAVARGCALK
jgi:hypothetical protein